MEHQGSLRQVEVEEVEKMLRCEDGTTIWRKQNAKTRYFSLVGDGGVGARFFRKVAVARGS